jgi:hypothetical protein
MAKDKLDLMGRIIDDEEIAKALISTSPGFKDYVLKEGDVEQLPWNRVYPCRYMIDTQTPQKCYITMGFSYSRSNSHVFKAGRIDIFIFCHKDLVRTDYGILRPDFILQRVDSLIAGSRGEWLGRMEFVYAEDLMVGETGDYVGVTVGYRNVEAQ